MYIGALEAGGTKMVCAIGTEKGKILDRKSIPTNTPSETIPAILDYFTEQNQAYPLSAIGIAAFGPVDVRPQSPDYGKILDTPKLAWKYVDLLKPFREAFHLPLGLDTDVNGSCLGEMTYGSAKGLDTVAYLTIGTGIGAGIAVGGKLVHGMLHPEQGHIPLVPQPGDENNCICPYHTHCFEGLASGPSIEKRYGKKAYELSGNPLVWELESTYIAQALSSLILTISPERIILGGGVMHQSFLFPLIREKVTKELGGYLKTSQLMDMDHYIVPASLGDDQGILGAVRLGELAFKQQST